MTDKIDRKLLEQAQELVALEQIEQYRMQMAAISTAAIGYWKKGGGILPDYDTPALRDVADLYAKYELLVAQTEQKCEWQGLTKDKLLTTFQKHRDESHTIQGASDDYKQGREMGIQVCINELLRGEK